MNTSGDSIYRLKGHILFAMFEEGGVIFNLDDRMSYVLNQTGACIIHLLDGKRDINKIIQDFAQDYGMPAESVYGDAMDFFKNLIERGWVNAK